MNTQMLMLALCAAFAIGNVDACLSGGDQNALLSLSNLLGVEPVTGADTYIPLGPAANLVLPSDDDVLEACKALLAPRDVTR